MSFYFSLITNENVIIVQSCYPQQDRRLIELFMMLDAAKDLGAKKLFAVVPYLAYARQDRRFREGETIGVNTVAKLIKSCGINTLLTVDIHEKESLKLFDINAINLSAMHEIGKYLKELGLNRPYVVAPDKGASEYAKKVAEVLGTDYTFFVKTRDPKTGKVRASAKDIRVRDHDVVIIDDIISTGGTVANVARILNDQGAKKVIAACTHALPLNGAQTKLKEAGIDEIVGTDAIESNVSRVTISNIFAEALKALL